ncbi:toxin-antitoxin system, antitoxin component, HicB domain protein [Ostertagia ostertagi]
MWFYYFICLSVLICSGFHNGFVNGEASSRRLIKGKMSSWQADNGWCKSPLWGDDYQHLCPNSCGIC